ncbi:MAG: elongation factor P [Firmicutes bacterium]|nr:elongation factor P [Candidatus Colivicinus equi]
MINCTEIKPGQCFTWENELYQCIESTLNKTAMAKMKVKIKVKVPRTGVVKELSFIGSDKVGEAEIEKRPMQFLYDSGDSMVFMDSESYEQIEIPKDRLSWESKFLIPNLDVNIQIYEGEVLGVYLPDKVEMSLSECEQAVKGDTATAALKNAITETGLLVKVPMFINETDKIIVSTIDGKYCGRA